MSDGLTSYLKYFVAAFLISLVALSAITYLANVPYPYDQYYSLYTLGATRTAEHYFPGDDVDILLREQISWYVAVYNHMGSVQLVRILFKIMNSTMTGPDQLTNLPGQRDAFYEVTRLLDTNDTWTLPVSWSILNATVTTNATTINSILFNGEAITENVPIEALHGYNFRIVIELWVYDETSGNFTYAWTANGAERSTWNQIWFNMTRLTLIP
jgi:hypothetical protein